MCFDRVCSKMCVDVTANLQLLYRLYVRRVGQSLWRIKCQALGLHTREGKEGRKEKQRGKERRTEKFLSM